MKLDKEYGFDTYFCLEDDMSSLEKYLHLGKKKYFKKGEQILSIGEHVQYLYYLKAGRAGRLITAVNGAEKYIKVVCDRSIVGEVVFFRQTVNNGQFVAIEDCECYLFDKETVYKILLKDEQVIGELIQWFCNRMTSLNAQVTESLVKNPHYRICKFLYDYVKKFGRIDEMGRYVYEGKLSHYDIAKFLGINRVSVTNVVKELQESGIIQKERARLIILNTEYMKQL